MKPKRVHRRWTVTVPDGDDVFSMLAVVDGRGVPTDRMATVVLRTKGKKTSTHAADIPKGWTKRYHSYCRVALGLRPADDPQGPGYVILRCL